VLTGRHEGASAPLDSAVTLIGSGGDYDIVLTDPGIATLHASVAFNPEGRPVVRWHAPQAGAAAPSSAESSAGAAADTSTQPAAGSASGVAGEGAAKAIGTGAGGKAAEASRRPVEPDWYEPWQIGPVWVALAPAHFEWKQSQRWPRPDSPAAAGPGRARRAVLWSVAGLAVVGGLLAASGAGTSFAGADSLAAAARSTYPHTVDLQQQQQLRARLAELKLADARLDAGSATWAITGFVATAAERDALAQAVRAIRPGLALRVTVGDELAQRAREFLADPGIEASYAGGGRLRLAGKPQALTEAVALDRSLGLLRADLGASVALQDALDRSQVRVAAAEPVVHAMPVRIAEVHADEPAHFRDAGGARYFEGARLADGAEVVRIRADEILFRKNGREIRYAVVE